MAPPTFQKFLSEKLVELHVAVVEEHERSASCRSTAFVGRDDQSPEAAAIAAAIAAAAVRKEGDHSSAKDGPLPSSECAPPPHPVKASPPCEAPPPPLLPPVPAVCSGGDDLPSPVGDEDDIQDSSSTLPQASRSKAAVQSQHPFGIQVHTAQSVASCINVSREEKPRLASVRINSGPELIPPPSADRSGNGLRFSDDTASDVEDKEDRNKSLFHGMPPKFHLHDIWRKSGNQVSQAHPAGLAPMGGHVNKKSSGILDDEEFEEHESGYWVQKCSDNVVVHPGSGKRLSWDLVGFLFVFYDGIMIPIQLFQPPESIFLDIMMWLARVFWTIDMFLSFITGYQEGNGHIEQHVVKIGIHYMKSWFLLDLLIVGIDWMEVITTSSTSGAKASRGVAKTMRTMRVLRAIRLLRLIRLFMNSPELTGKISFMVRSEEVMIIMGIIKIITMVAGLLHVIACCWYGLGCDAGEWVVTYHLQDASFGYRYATSYHWALTQFIGSADILPQNHVERAFSVIVLMVAFITSGVVISSITTNMTRLQIVTAHYSKQLSMLKRYLIENNISSALASRVQRNAKHVIAEQKKNIKEESVELLLAISMPLRVEIHMECNGPALCWHPFFKAYSNLNVPAFRHLCHVAISRLKLSKGDVAFSEGEIPQNPSMLIVLDGKLMYMREGKRPMFLEAQGWANEVHLWLGDWVHHGQLRALSECDLLCLRAEAFQATAIQFRAREFYPAKYAAVYVERMNTARAEDICELNNDSIDAHEVARKVFPFCSASTQSRMIHGSNNHPSFRKSMIGAIGGMAKRMSHAGPAHGGHSSKDRMSVLSSNSSFVMPVIHDPRSSLHDGHLDALPEDGRMEDVDTNLQSLGAAPKANKRCKKSVGFDTDNQP